MCLLWMLICLSACGSCVSEESGTVSVTNPPTTAAADTKEASMAVESAALLPIPGRSADFSFLSGAGGWRTRMLLNADGSFTGVFHDSEMGEVGEGYSKGSVYVCSFSGKFTDIERIHDYAYRMNLYHVETERQPGETWIEDDIRYVAHDPYGIEEGETFIFYLPDTPLSEVPEAFLIWWPYRYDQNAENRETLSCYGILNKTTDYGFFYAE